MICSAHHTSMHSHECMDCKLQDEREAYERLRDAAMADLVRLNKRIQHLRGVVWHTAELIQEIHENPQYATSPVIMRMVINNALRDAQELP